MKRQIDNAIRRAARRGVTPVEIRLGGILRKALLEEDGRTANGRYRNLPIVEVATADHASLKVSEGSHIVIAPAAEREEADRA